MQMLDQLLKQAEQELEAASAGRPLCRAGEDIASVDPVKFAEGKWSALRELQRALPATASERDFVVEGMRLLNRWRQDLDHWRQFDDSAWLPYCAGGISGLQQFLDVSPS